MFTRRDAQKLLELPESWSILTVAELFCVALVQMPVDYPERLLPPHRERITCAAPAWLPPHPQDAALVVEVHWDRTPEYKAQALARGIVRVACPALEEDVAQLCVCALVTRYSWRGKS